MYRSFLGSLRGVWGARRLYWRVLLERRVILKRWGDPFVRIVWRHRAKLAKVKYNGFFNNTPVFSPCKGLK